jgi:hypothetical protein
MISMGRTLEKLGPKRYVTRVRGREILGRSTTLGVLSVLRKQTAGERSVQGFLDRLVRSTKTVMTRVEFGGTLFLVAVIGVLLTSREEGGKSN